MSIFVDHKMLKHKFHKLLLSKVMLRSWAPNELGIRKLDDSGYADLFLQNLFCDYFEVASQFNWGQHAFATVQNAYFSTQGYPTSSITLRSVNGGSYRNCAKLLGGFLELLYGKLTGDLDVSANNIGPLLIDRVTGTKYRLYVSDGVLGIEAV